MFKTQIIEVTFHPDHADEQVIGYCIMGQVKVPHKDADDDTPPDAIKVNGERYFILGQSWDVRTSALHTDAAKYNAVQVLIVRAFPKAASPIIQDAPKPKIIL